MGGQWLRKYRVLAIVGTPQPDGTFNAIDVSGLRCTFRVCKSPSFPNYSDVTIWNASQEVFDEIINAGTRVIIEAGYEDTIYGKGAYGIIYDGNVIQTIWDRPNVVDWTLTMHCVDGDLFWNNNFISMSFGANQDMVDMVSQMCQNAMTPAEVGFMSPDLRGTSLPRGKVFFGEPKYYLRQFAAREHAQANMKDGKVNIGKVDDQSLAPQDAPVLSPKTGLVGTPQQTQDGIRFRCLLNPNLDFTYPYQLVKLDPKVVIQQTPIVVPQLVPRLDREGLYKVIRVIHSGDTRGNEWYSDITGVNSDAQGTIPQFYEVGKVADG